MFRFTKALSLMFFSGLVFAAATTTPNTTTTQAPVAPAASEQTGSIIGEFEIRPSWGSQVGEVHTENTASLGYKFNKNLLIDYTQYFNNNISNPDNTVGALKISGEDSMIRLKASDVYKNNDTSLGLQTRVLPPTESGKRDAGMLFVWRNQATVAQKLNNTVSVDFTAAPMLHAYNRSGNLKSANPWFQQRFVLNTDITLTDKLTFSVPVILDATRTRDYSATAANNNRWNYVLWAWPELDYQLTSNLKIGTAWYSDNFMTDDATTFTLANGFEKGIFQVLVNYTL